MKKTILMGTLAAALAASQAQAGVIDTTPLQHATVSASYNGDAGNILGLDHAFAAEAGSNVTTLDPLDGPGGVEYLTGDFLFGIDFSHAGLVTVMSNGPVPTGAYNLRFDFGATLPAAIKAFTLVDHAAIGGLPQLSVIDAHTIGLDLSSLTWNGDYAAFTSQIELVNDVPEPAGPAVLLAGLAGMALVRRRR
jgi:hypothetical protein